MAVNSFVFDEQFYLTQNPDVAAAVSAGGFASGQAHFNEFGRFEGRDPNAYFDTSFYLGTYPDVAAANVNPFTHFQANGAAEGRLFNANIEGTVDTDGDDVADEFDSAAYLAANTDVAAAIPGQFASAYQHYVLFGQFEGRPGAQLTDGTALNGPFQTGSTGGGNVGQTLTLTTGVDNLTGTAADDTFSGVYNGGTVADGTTFNTGDTLNGGTGNDMLRVVTTVGGAVVPTLSGIETLDGQVFNGVTLGANLATSTGVNKLSLTNGNGDLTATNVGKLVDLELNNTNTTGGTSAITATYQASVVSGSADVQNVSVNSAIGAVNVAGVETMNVASTGAAPTLEMNQIGITAGALKTLNISGDGKLNVAGALGTTVTTVDASGSTGGVGVQLGASDVKVTGGKGDDAFEFNATLTKADTVDGGEGTDTVSVTGGNLSLATNGTLQGINALTSIERVAFTGGAATTVNGSTFKNAGVTNLLFDTKDAGTDTINNAGSARTYEFGTANTGAAAFNMMGGSTTLNVALNGSDPLQAVAQDGSDADVAGINVVLSGTEPAGTKAAININSIGDLNTTVAPADVNEFNETGMITAVSGSTVTVTGSANVAIFGGTAGAVTEGFDNNVTLNSSALTGSTVLAGSSFDAGSVGALGAGRPAGIDRNGDGDIADAGEGVVAAGAGANTVMGEGVDSFTLGAGKDTIVFADGLASGVIEIATPAGGATANDAAATGNILHDTITGFTAGANGDLLFRGTDLTNAVSGDDYTAIQAASQTSIDALAGATATLQNAANIAANDAAGAWTAFSFQGNTYALYDTVNGGATYENEDTLVRLTGVNVGDLTDANFAV